MHPTHWLISTQEPGAPLVCCNYFNLLEVTLGLAQFDEAVALLLQYSPRRKDEMSRLQKLVAARAKASPDSLVTICVLIKGEGWNTRETAYSVPCEVKKVDEKQLFQVHFGVSFWRSLRRDAAALARAPRGARRTTDPGAAPALRRRRPARILPRHRRDVPLDFRAERARRDACVTTTSHRRYFQCSQPYN